MRNVKFIFIINFTFQCFISRVHSDTAIGLEVIPERADIQYINPNYVKDAYLNVRRVSKRGGYGINAGGILLHSWGNNISVDLIAYEYLNNEYKRSFVELHYKLCDMMYKTRFIGKILLRHLCSCPLTKGLIAIANGTILLPSFPDVFPIQKGKFEIIIKLTEPPQEIAARANVFVKFNQLSKGRTNNK